MTTPTAPRAFPDTSTLFATDHGSVSWTTDGQLALSLGDLKMRLRPNAVRSVHRAALSLAADVYRCGTTCRWQLRVPDRPVLVLSSDDVLRLETLLAGAVAMLDLDALLNDAGIAWAASTDAVGE